MKKSFAYYEARVALTIMAVAPVVVGFLIWAALGSTR